MRAVESPSLATLAYERIRGGILEGSFAGGEQLVEKQLADELGTSRAPIREALHKLVEEGLVEYRPRHGAFVREFSGREVVDIYNVRFAIETVATRLAVRRRASLAPLERAVEQMRAAGQRGDLPAVVAAELRFHEALCELSGNALLLEIFHGLSARIRAALSVDNSAYGDLRDVAEEHVPLLEALASGDERRAREAIQRHIVLTVKVPLRGHAEERGDLLDPLV
jgi:DNA-binding GntR family transcriptional regulator